jgi:hypothetical protein
MKEFTHLFDALRLADYFMSVRKHLVAPRYCVPVRLSKEGPSGHGATSSVTSMVAKNKKEQPEADDRADEQQDDGQVRPSAYAGSDRKCRN